MRKFNILAVIVLTMIITAKAQKVNAQSLNFSQNVNQSSFIDIEDLLGVKPIKPKKVEKKKVEVKPKEVEKPQVVEYTVVEGDTLTKIAEAHNTKWERLWQKNTNLTNQDVLNVGDKIVIPDASEVLADRPVNVPVVTQNAPQVAQISSQAVSGNTYDYGYCTWYVKNRRPDLPNRMGNANAWYGSAQAMGLSTGSVPRVGAVGVSFAGFYGHVVYVESVNGSTITVSEMNYAGWNIVSSRTANAGEFVYIY